MSGNPTQEMLARATARLQRGDFDVGAALDRELNEPGRDEARVWRFLLVDRSGRSESVDFLATRIARRSVLVGDLLEDAVEHHVACTYPAESRLAMLKFESECQEEPLHLPLAARHRREPAAA